MISDNIYTLMKERNMSQMELAKKANISQSTLSAILHGTHPTDKTLANLAESLGVSVKELSEDSGTARILECPRCGSHAIVEWNHYNSGRCRIHCAYCDLDTGEQHGRAQAVRIFNSFKKTKNDASDGVHVLTLDELLDSSFADADNVRPVWFENRGLFITPSLVQCGIAEREQDLVRVWWWNGNGNKSYMFDQYNSWWRCWSGKPTWEMSEATPWKE